MEIDYLYSTDSLTTKEWIDFLQTEREANIEILKIFYEQPKHMASHKELKVKYGLSTGKLNGAISNSIAKRINKEYGIFPQKRINGKGYNWFTLVANGWQEEYFIWQLKPELVKAMKILYDDDKQSLKYVVENETKENFKYYEGRMSTKLTRYYERNSEARKKCLEINGYDCKICEMNFEKTYGEKAKDFIHVHHIVPISKFKSKYEVNPKTDLVPLCPNCHAIVHMKSFEGLAIDEIKNLLKR